MKRLLSALVITIMFFTITSQTFGASATNLYSNKKLGWSINLLTGMTKNASDSKENEANFKDEKDTKSVSVNMYSVAGLTLDSWVNKELKNFKENYNSTSFIVLKTENSKLGSIKCKKIYVKYLSGGKWFNACNMYIIGKNYRYMASYSIISDDYKIATKKAAMDSILASFKFTEPSTKAVGVLAEASNSVDSKKHIKIKSEQYGWSYEIPDTWQKVMDNDSLSIYQVNNYELTSVLSVTENLDNKSLVDCAKAFEANLVKDKTSKIKSKNSINVNGIEFMQYTVTVSGVSETLYLTTLNGNVYTLQLLIAQYADILKNSKVLDAIWKSLKISDTGTGNSIKDYNTIFNGAMKDKIGDSYYNWSFSASKAIKVKTRTFNGSHTMFATDDEKCAFQVFISNNDKKLNLDAISANLLESVKDDYTVIASEKQTNGEQEYSLLAYRGDKDNFVNEHHTYIVGDKIYQVILTVEQEEYNKKTYSSMIDSFRTKFLNDGSTNDLSDINSNGLRTYKNRNFNWSIDVLPDWYEEKEDNKGNNVNFVMDVDNYVFVTMYSTESGLTLDKWVQDEITRMDSVYNKQLVNVSRPMDIVIKGVNCKRINVSFNINGKVYYDSYIYIIGKNYRYMFGYSLDNTKYGNAADKANFEKVISSFSFSEPDVNKVGKLFDPKTANYNNSTRTISSKEFNWSVILPTSFTAEEDNNDDDSVDYYDSNRYFDFNLYAYKVEKTLDEYVASEEQYYKQQSSTYTYLNTETLNEKGTTVKKITYKYSSPKDYFSYYDICYMLLKNGYVYYVYFEVTDIRNTDYSNQVFKTIWDSMTF